MCCTLYIDEAASPGVAITDDGWSFRSNSAEYDWDYLCACSCSAPAWIADAYAVKVNAG